MIVKRVLAIEDHLELSLMQRLFEMHIRPKEYELVTYPDLSDEKVYKRHLPEGFDIYWVHISAVENEALTEIKEKQPWSTIVIRSNQSPEDSLKLHPYFMNTLGVNRVISRHSGVNEKFILETLKEFGVGLIIAGDAK
ncbi:hypothetical protein J4477_02110 [Candidatus Pacearchaeota archaeon]|nr:hypothetical protein [Candidatus Pacearchaeota archaeon]